MICSVWALWPGQGSLPVWAALERACEKFHVGCAGGVDEAAGFLGKTGGAGFSTDGGLADLHATVAGVEAVDVAVDVFGVGGDVDAAGAGDEGPGKIEEALLDDGFDFAAGGAGAVGEVLQGDGAVAAAGGGEDALELSEERVVVCYDHFSRSSGSI